MSSTDQLNFEGLEPHWQGFRKIIFSDVDPQEKLILATIYQHYPEAIPSHRRLVDITKLSEKTIRRRIQDMGSRGVLIVRKRSIGRSQTSNHYRIVWESLGEITTGPLVTQTVPPGQADQRSINVFDCLFLDTFKSEENKEELLAVWREWVIHRRRGVMPLTQDIARRQLEMLSAHEYSVRIEIIEHSLRNGYVGLFEPRQNGRPVSSQVVFDPDEPYYPG